MIRFDNVSKSYRPGRLASRRAPPVRALVEASFRIAEGEAWSIVGPNGAGKTTLLALLLGFLHPTGGEIAVAGDSPRSYIRRHGAAYLPERFRLPPEWSVRAALTALARLEGRRGPAAVTSADSAIHRFGLESWADRALGTLSRGLLQRVGLAQANLAPRALVVLDEPTEGLDPLWRIRFRSFVDGLRREGRTIVIASHDLGEVERMTDRALLLEDGRIRDILDVTLPGPVTRYRLVLAADTAAIAEVFPGARAEPADADPAGSPAPGPTESPGTRTYTVSAADPTELSRRLAALIEAGGVVVSVAPAAEPLEERVRRALREKA